MKILIINGTPKMDGICYSFVQTAENTAKEIGVEFETIRLTGLGLKKCVMCDDGWGICFKEHVCIFGEKDGFNALQKTVQEADAYIYITPVYWGEISEEMKIFFDKLRRCQATKQWDSREEEVSYLKGKPSIMVASAGRGGGGIVSCFADIERAVSQMSGDNWPRELSGIFDYIAVNRWNQAYKRDTLTAAIKEMVKFKTRPLIKKVAALPDYKLDLTFDNDERRILDMKSRLETEHYSELKDVALFENVKITGTHIEWRPLLDLGPDPLYFESDAM